MATLPGGPLTLQKKAMIEREFWKPGETAPAGKLSVHSGSRFVKGDFATLERLINQRGPRSLNYQFAVVQPGISKAGLEEDGAAVLAAADEYVRSIGAMSLIVLASA